MEPEILFFVALLMALAAALYSSVGHGGASAYLAIMALFAVAPETMRPTALALNLVVAGLGMWRYGRAGDSLTTRRRRSSSTCAALLPASSASSMSEFIPCASKKVGSS